MGDVAEAPLLSCLYLSAKQRIEWDFKSTKSAMFLNLAALKMHNEILLR